MIRELSLLTEPQTLYFVAMIHDYRHPVPPRGAATARSSFEHPLKTSVSTCVTSAGSAHLLQLHGESAYVTRLPAHLLRDLRMVGFSLVT